MKIELHIDCKRKDCPGNQRINESQAMTITADKYESMDAAAECPACGNKIDLTFYMERPK